MYFENIIIPFFKSEFKYFVFFLNKGSMKENHTYVAEKNEEVLFSAEIRVVGSYTDRLLNGIFLPFFKTF